MSVITIHTSKIIGIEAVDIVVETTVTPGIGLRIVGLADAAVKESLLRTVTALQSLGYHIPGKKIVINLAPADLHKTGETYDLAIALGIIAASGQAELPDTDKWLVLGEVALDGTLRAVPGCIPTVFLGRRMNLAGCIIPKANAREVLPYAGDFPVYAVDSLADAVKVIRGEYSDIPTVQEMTFPEEKENAAGEEAELRWKSLAGNEGAKRALEIAAAGGHNLLLIGPVGTQKSTLARALVDLLPPMGDIERAIIDGIYNVAGKGMMRPEGQRPFRAPHVSASMVALLGGGAGDNILPGEVSLASSGVLFLDNAAEMPKASSEALRGPLEDKKVTISRLKSRIEYPTRFQLVAGTTMCPCGWYGYGERCKCTPKQRALYMSHLSPWILDRIAVQAWTQPPVNVNVPTESLDTVKERVAKAREMQAARYSGAPIMTNDELTSQNINGFVKLNQECKVLLDKLIDRLGLSARSYTPILKIARTIADLAACEEVGVTHIAEAASYRFLDRYALWKELTCESAGSAAPEERISTGQ